MIDDTRPAPFLQRHVYGALGFVLLAALYLLPGAIGHDPWRGEDIRHFGVVFDMLRGQGLLFPHLAGEPFTEFPPLYFWVAGGLAALLGGLLEIHNAARLATPVFVVLAILWIARAAEHLYGEQARTPAALLTLGTLGLVVHAHEHQPMIALMAMQALTLFGLARLPAQPAGGSLLVAAGILLAFLAGGLPGLLLTVPLALLLLVGCGECRTPRVSGGLILGLSLGLGACTLWPLAVHYQSPELFALWWQREWSGFGSGAVTAGNLSRLLELFGWFAWPLWPIALWSLWRARKQIIRLPWAMPLGAALLALGWIVVDGGVRPTAMLAVIAPLALLAGAGISTLRRGAANAFDWFGVMTFAVFALLVWLGWSAQVVAWPPGLARHVARVAPDFMLSGAGWRAAIGTAICIAWILLVVKLPRSPNRASINWAMGMTMLWCLAVTLLLPWFDYERSYRPAARSLAQALSQLPSDCVAAHGLNPGLRAAMLYFGNVNTVKVTGDKTACPLLLLYDDRNPPNVALAAEWQPVWQFSRGGGRKLETFFLYRRE